LSFDVASDELCEDSVDEYRGEEEERGEGDGLFITFRRT
jgi:hypothetical protein